MTGRYEHHAVPLSGGSNPLDDPLVAAWDAVVQGNTAMPAGCDPVEIAVLQRFHAMEMIPPPSDAFFADLEGRLTRLRPQPVNDTGRSFGGEKLSATNATQSHFPQFSASDRRFPPLAAAAALVILLIVGPLGFSLTHTTPSEPSAIPAAVVLPPEMETLIQMDFEPPLWDMPPGSAWEQMEISMFMVDPGATFSTDIPWYTSVDGPLLIVPVSGNLIIQAAGPAYVHRYGSSAPVETSAGEPAILGPNDAIVFSSRATAVGNNPGSEPVRAIYAQVGVFDDAMAGDIVEAVDVTQVDINYESHLLMPSDGASISIEHLALAPLDTFVYEPDPEWKMIPIYIPLQLNDLRMYDGAAEDLSPALIAEADYASLAKLKFPGPGPQTLINIGDETVDLYFLNVRPYGDTAPPSA